MRQLTIAIILLILIIAGVYFFVNRPNTRTFTPSIKSPVSSQINPSSTAAASIPLISKDRVTKKPFGKYVEPGNSPVNPEKFTGFHTASDFEAFESELDQEIEVKAVCDGEISEASTVSGYGGLLVQNCQFNKLESKVLYGHVDIKSVKTKTAGTIVSRGETISILAPAYSPANGDERKHLHLGILKTNAIDYRGYVQNESELEKWYDPVALLGL